MNADKTLNDILVKLFNDLMEIEEKCLISGEFMNISGNDMHIIEAIGLDFERSSTDNGILSASRFSITVPNRTHSQLSGISNGTSSAMHTSSFLPTFS